MVCAGDSRLRAAKLCIGRVLSTHGLAGWLKINLFSDNIITRCQQLPQNPFFIALTAGKTFCTETVLRLDDVRLQARPVLFLFNGCSSAEAAGSYCGWYLWVDRAELLPCDDNEFFYADLYGCRLVHSGEELARVVAVIDGGGSNILLEVDDGQRKCFVPFVDHFIGEVDVDNALIELKQPWIISDS